MAPKWLQQQKQTTSRGNGPPPVSEMPRGALVARLLDSPRPHKRGFDFPRTTDDGVPVGKFAIWVLTQEDVDLCRADAERYVSALMRRDDASSPAANQEAWRETYNSALFVEVLFRALRQDDDLSQPLFRAPDEIRQLLTDDEVVHLYEAYAALQHCVGPLFRILTDAEVEQWIDAIGDGADQYPFELCSRGQLVALVRSFALQMRHSKIGEPSFGSASTSGADDIPNTSATTQSPDQ